jgi:hypothetical protein
MNPPDNFRRCIDAARACQRNPSVVCKQDFPSRADFDSALDELADVFWDAEAEPAWRAYGHALDSPDGKLLYAAREQARYVEPVHQQEPEVITKAEARIHQRITKYQKNHPGVTPEQALIRVLENDPQLYTQYLSECR